MTRHPIKVRIVFPTTEIGSDVAAICDFAQAVEEMGFDSILALDRLLGVNPANRPDWGMISPYTHESTIQEPLMLFSYLAGVTKTIGLVTSVIVLPQRQTLLFAKQAANLDQYCQGRLTLGVGIGQNPVEYAAMGMQYKTRTAVMEEQIHFLRRYWTEPWFSDNGKFHKIVEAGINPLPLQRPIPIWISAHAAAGVDRAARISDGLMCFLDASLAEETIGSFREAVKKHGRDPDQVRVANCIVISTIGVDGKPVPEDVASCVEVWQKAGAREITLHTMDMGLHGVEQHIEYLRGIAQVLKLARKTEPAPVDRTGYPRR